MRVLLFLLITIAFAIFIGGCDPPREHIKSSFTVYFEVSDTNKVLKTNTPLVIRVKVPRKINLDNGETINISRVVSYDPIVVVGQYNDTNRCSATYYGFSADKGNSYSAQFQFKGNLNDTFVWEARQFNSQDTGVYEFESYIDPILKVSTDKGDIVLKPIPEFKVYDQHIPLLESRCPTLHRALQKDPGMPKRFYAFQVIQ